MSHEEWSGNVITNDRQGRSAERSDNVWGIAFYAIAPWPTKMCIQDYDVGEPVGEASGKRTIRFDVENGFAVYEVIGRCEYGCAYHCDLLQSSYRRTKAARMAAA